MSLKGKAKEVLKIIEDGGFQSAENGWVDLKEYIEFSTKNTRIYYPEGLEVFTTQYAPATSSAIIEVTEETTQIATKRLYNEGLNDLVLLSFASARNPGGGFINGAKAQEEDLARCSTIYKCLLSQPQYYEANRNQESMLYTDHLIYSPNVPWFRTRSRDKPTELYFASVITAPAPNANQAIRHGESKLDIEKALKRRTRYVLEVASENGHKNLILGAWGCGVFGNDPYMVANSFQFWINSDLFSSKFKKIVFAIYDNSETKATLNAFKEVFNA